MIVKRVIHTEDGQVEATLMLSSEQAAFLMNAGLSYLVQSGVAHLQDFSPEEFEAEKQKVMKEQGETGKAANEAEPANTTVSTTPEQKDKAEKAYLAAVDIHLIPKA